MKLEVPEINSNARYWLVRTDSGDNYIDFVEHNYVKIYYDAIEKVPQEMNKEFKQEIQKKYKNESIQSIGIMLGEIHRFQHQMKVGDYIIIPAHNTSRAFKQKLSIGIIKSDMFIDTATNNNEKRYIKYRKIEWIQTHIDKEDCNINLRQIFYRHNAVSCVDKYSIYIDSLLYPLHIKNSKIIVYVKINEQGQIRNSLLAEILKMYEDLLSDVGTVTITSKININSPGDIIVTIIENSPKIAEAIGILFVAGVVSFKVLFSITNFINSASRIKGTIKIGNFEFSYDYEKNTELKNKLERIEPILQQVNTELIGSKTEINVYNNYDKKTDK